MRVKSAVTSPTKGREGALDHHRVFFQNALNTCGAIVEDLMRDPAAAIFCRPVDPERDEEDFTMEDYLEVILARASQLVCVRVLLRDHSGCHPFAPSLHIFILAHLCMSIRQWLRGPSVSSNLTMHLFSQVISTPMDLGEVMRKFRAREYTSAQHMREDVVQVHCRRPPTRRLHAYS